MQTRTIFTTFTGLLLSTGLLAQNTLLNNVRAGEMGHGAGWGGLSHAGQALPGNYGFLQSEDGSTTLINKANTGTGFIGFRIGNTDRMTINNSGNVTMLGRLNIGGNATHMPMLDVFDNSTAFNGIKASLRRSGAGDVGLSFQQNGYSAFGLVHRSDANRGLAFVDNYWEGSAGAERMRITWDGRLGLGTSNPRYRMDVNGDLIANGWLRSTGTTGWYNESFGGGWYMADATWIRNYNNKPVYLTSSGGVQVQLNNVAADDFARMEYRTAGSGHYWHSAARVNDVNRTDSYFNLFSSQTGDVLSLRGDGQVRLPAYAGGGQRMVTVDNNGFLVAQPIAGNNCSALSCSGSSVGIGQVPDMFRLSITSNVDELFQLSRTGGFNTQFKTGGDGAFVIRHNNNIAMKVSATGKVNIGPDFNRSDYYALAVNGPMLAREVRVTATGWADFVFRNNHEPMPLGQLESFIRRNGHLPGIPTEKEVMKDGIDLGAMTPKLLEKIEELTLYIIEKDKQMAAMKTMMEKMEKNIQSLQNR